MERWEYKTDSMSTMDRFGMRDQLNQHGAAGWELVVVWADKAIFKRPLVVQKDEKKCAKEKSPLKTDGLIKQNGFKKRRLKK